MERTGNADAEIIVRSSDAACRTRLPVFTRSCSLGGSKDCSYVSYPLDSRGRYGVVEMAHHWGMHPWLLLRTMRLAPGTGSRGRDRTGYLLSGLASLRLSRDGLSETYTLLYPEQLSWTVTCTTGLATI